MKTETPKRGLDRVAGRNTVLMLVAALALGIVAWTAMVLAGGHRFAIPAPQVDWGIEAAAALARLFGAVVLVLFSEGRREGRMPWVASGLLVLGLGDLGFSYLEALFENVLNLNATSYVSLLVYESLLVWAVAAVLFALGLVPDRPPVFRRWPVLVALVALLVSGIAIEAVGDGAAGLFETGDPPGAFAYETYRSGSSLSEAYRTFLFAVPIAIAVVVALGAARQYRRGTVAGWLPLAMSLMVVAQLHNLFPPSTSELFFATADVPELAFAAVVFVGGVKELRRVAAERARLLAAEKEQTRRLEELAEMKADFTAMVAHELNSPLFAIRGLADMAASENLSPERRRRALDAIQAEADALDALINDVRASAKIERDDFAVEPLPVPMDALLDAAAAYAATLPGDHPFDTVVGTNGDSDAASALVLADQERIGQVLRNLLSNAARYSPEGSPIELRAIPLAGRIRLEVADRGRGIRPDDLPRIFEKFDRGRDREARRTSGMGLGLYLSRRIVRAHNAELTVNSTPGEGSVFAFELESVGKDSP